jgi:hypothetical protein
MEEIRPYIKPPWWTLTHIANIPKDKAKMEHKNLLKNNNALNTLYVYTDGSGIKTTLEQQHTHRPSQRSHTTTSERQTTPKYTQRS